MSAILEILIALPGAGKSTYAKNILKEDSSVIIVSSDAIRKELYGSEEDQSHNQEVFNEVFKRTRDAIKDNKHCIIDSTNLSRKRRIAFLKQFNNCEKRATVFAIPFEVCCERNNSRERIVPQHAMERMFKSFQPPAYEEGFNEINVITWGSDNTTLEDILDRNGIPHDNHHHTFNCREHCLATEAIARKISKREELAINDTILLTMAARYHDIGKFMCKTFFDYKGNSTKEAHFYSHQNVSAYLFLCYDVDLCIKEKVFVANLIYHHMDFSIRDFKTEKMLFNKDFKKFLRLLNESDKGAH
jgi:predicted kinase